MTLTQVFNENILALPFPSPFLFNGYFIFAFHLCISSKINYSIRAIYSWEVQLSKITTFITIKTIKKIRRNSLKCRSCSPDVSLQPSRKPYIYYFFLVFIYPVSKISLILKILLLSYFELLNALENWQLGFNHIVS